MSNPQLHKNHRRGGILIMAAAGAIFFLGMTVLVTDVGWMYYNKIRLQTAVSASWKAGFDYASVLMAVANGAPLSAGDKTKVTQRIQDVFQKNGYTGSQAVSLNINFSTTASAPLSLSVSSTLPVGLFFAKIFNIPWANVSADRGGNLIATGTTDNGGEAGLIPLGILHGDLFSGQQGEGRHANDGLFYHPFGQGEGFVPGREYLLRVGKNSGQGTHVNPLPDPSTYLTGGGNSNEGSIRLGGNGKDYWGDIFLNGYPGRVELNSRWNTEPGVAVGPVTTARDTRISNGGLMVIVPIIDVPPSTSAEPVFYNLGGNQLIRVIGFAQFQLTSPGEADYRPELGAFASNDVEIRGTFVKYIVNPNEVPAGVITDP